jgi:hypothetical protein
LAEREALDQGMDGLLAASQRVHDLATCLLGESLDRGASGHGI